MAFGKLNINNLLNDAAKSVQGLVDQASKSAASAADHAGKGIADAANQLGHKIADALDQDGDGSLTLDDIKVAVERKKQTAAENKRKADLEKLKPLFLQDFDTPSRMLTKLIRIAEADAERAANPVCANAVGFRTVTKDMEALTIYPSEVECFGLQFFPTLENNLYLVDPADPKRYIALEDYYHYMEKARVTELMKIAQKLGARHFRVTYRKRSDHRVSQSIKAEEKIKYGGVTEGTKG